MLLRALFSRRTATGDGDGAFRVRGEAVSRLEGFSDTVFGFAITLLVISLKAPESATELLDLRHQILPFMASFFALFVIWRAQFAFFRRYGLEDRRTITLTGILLAIVLLAIYPLRFLSSFMLDVLPRALLAGNDSMKASMTMELIPKVMMLYAIGVAGVMATFSLLYRHAASRSEALGLSDMELFDTRIIARRYAGVTLTTGTLVLWCAGMQLLDVEHVRARDVVWRTAYNSMSLAVLLVAATQAAVIRRMNRARPVPSPAVPAY